MRRPVFTALIIISLAHTAFAQSAPALSAGTPLIERAKLFGNPSKMAGNVSPDGKWLSWIAPRDGVLNVWVAPIDKPGDAKPLTAEKTRPIRAAFWAPDSKTLLFINDKGGDENYLLYGVDVANGKQTLLTPFEKTRVMIVNTSRQVKDRILVGINNRDPRWHDIYSLDLATGRLSLVYKNEGGYARAIADKQLNLRVLAKPRSDGGIDYYRMADGKVEATPFVQVGLDDSLTTGPLGFTTDGKTLYWADSRGRDTAALVAQDFATGASKVVAQDTRADITSGLFDVRSGRLQAYELAYLKHEYVPLDASLSADLQHLQQTVKGDFHVTGRSDQDDKWIVEVDPVAAPVSDWLYDRKSKRLTRLFDTRPELADAPLVPMFPAEIKSRDGLNLVSYLSLPRSADRDGTGKAAHPVPLVLLVHGGPWARDSFGANPYHQWLANRGYAVLSVNYRGSTGFGKGFISKGDLQWGRKMHDDLLDAIDWAVKSGITTRDKVAIMGGSYGGYATLAGMTFTPSTFACGVDIVGPSNLFTLLQTIPPYWEAGKQQFYKRMGDPTTEEGRALLKERSPLNFADKITKPLLIGQGANDPRVNVRESDQIVAAMDAKHIPVTYVVFPDEGHGFARPVNNIAFNAVAENFLGSCLGGHAEPINGALKPSTAQVKQGAGFVPGLTESAAGME